MLKFGMHGENRAVEDKTPSRFTPTYGGGRERKGKGRKKSEEGRDKTALASTAMNGAM